MTITSLTARFMRKIQVREWEPCEAEMTVTAIFGELEKEPDLYEAMELAKGIVQDALELSVLEQSKRTIEEKAETTVTKDEPPKADPEVKPKRKRRSKAEMAEAKAKDPKLQDHLDEKQKERKQEEEPKDNVVPIKGDEITDEEIQTVASEAADIITTKGVKALLAEFKVKKTAELSQEERQEFIKLIEEAKEDETTL